MEKTDLEAKLKQREVIRLEGKDYDGRDFEVRYYDTGQAFFKGFETQEKSNWEGPRKKTIEQIDAPSTFEFDSRSRLASHNWNGGGNGGYGIYNAPDYVILGMELLEKNGIKLIDDEVDEYDPRARYENSIKQYPELKELVEKLHKSYASRKVRMTDYKQLFEGLLATAVGHGNIPPWALLHPFVIFGIIKELFPFHVEKTFDAQKGKTKILKTEKALDDSVDLESYDDQVMLVSPEFIRGNEEKRYDKSIQVYVFNPAKYAAFVKNPTRLENPVPSKEDTIFKISYIWEHGRKSLHFFPYKFDSHNHMYEDLLKKRKYDVVFKADKEFVDTLEKISPLPLYTLKPKYEPEPEKTPEIDH